MAEASRIRSAAWSLLLLWLAACAAEADVISKAQSQGVGTGGPAQHEGGSFDAGAFFPPSNGPADAAGADAGVWGTETMGLLDSGGVPHWAVCDSSGDMLERARTGDQCSFIGGCMRTLPGCGRRTALCNDGVVHMSEITKADCVPDDPEIAGMCAAPAPEACCIELWQCDAATDSPQNVARVCALNCETAMFPRGDIAPYTGCPSDPDRAPVPVLWPPQLGTPCRGSFVCDSIGNAAGPDTPFTFDAYGRIYWCMGGVIQRVATGPSFPWND
jgi:hypothetical protein